ncbi:hypothetical protein [Sodalis sp. RH20]|uniref:hypothetical protein n=1 Tax=unclassified Sodalis (in: enterobacteria) TaxID=2636512 RepID=UPI0039B47F63
MTKITQRRYFHYATGESLLQSSAEGEAILTFVAGPIARQRTQKARQQGVTL